MEGMGKIEEMRKPFVPTSLTFLIFLLPSAFCLLL